MLAFLLLLPRIVVENRNALPESFLGDLQAIFPDMASSFHIVATPFGSSLAWVGASMIGASLKGE